MVLLKSLSLELATRTGHLVGIETAFFAVVNVVAFIENLLLCYAVYRNHRLRTFTNMFVIALAVSDILMSTCCMPFTVATLFHGRWMFGEDFCEFYAFEMFTFGMASLNTMGVIAVSRYFRVVKAEKYTVLFKKNRILIYIAIIWCVALVVSVPPFFFNKRTGFEFQPGKAMSSYKFGSNIPFTVFIEMYIGTPLLLITICYFKVFCAVSRSNRLFSEQNNLQQLRENVEEAKVTKTLAAVMVGFACCWLPVSIIDEIDAARGEHALPRQAYLTYSLLIYST